MGKCVFNIIDEKYYTMDNDGLVWGIGNTVEESIEEARFWGMDCSDIDIESDII